MLSLFRNYRLNKFLSCCRVTTDPEERFSMDLVEAQYNRIFNPKTSQGQQSFYTLVSSVYTQKDQRIRLKILILIHFLIKQHRSYAQLFLQKYQNTFTGQVQNYSSKSVSGISQAKTSSRVKVPPSVDTMMGLNSDSTECRTFNSIHNYLYVHVILPYHSYLIRLASNRQSLSSYKSNMDNKAAVKYCPNQCWKLLNIIKHLSAMKLPITHVGRYYKPQVKAMLDFLEIISEDLVIYKTTLERHLQYAFEKYLRLDQIATQNLILQVYEALQQAQIMNEVFHNRYYSEASHKVVPTWFSVDDVSLQIIERHYGTYFGMPSASQISTSRQSVVQLQCPKLCRSPSSQGLR